MGLALSWRDPERKQRQLAGSGQGQAVGNGQPEGPATAPRVCAQMCAVLDWLGTPSCCLLARGPTPWGEAHLGLGDEGAGEPSGPGSQIRDLRHLKPWWKLRVGTQGARQALGMQSQANSLPA